MSGLDTSLIQHGPNIYCVPGTVEEENGVGTWLQLSELQAPGPAACTQCCDGGSGSLHTAPVHSSTMGSAEGGKGLYSQAWGPAHSGRPTMPRHIRGSQGTSGHLGDALTPSGSKELHLAPFHPITLCISQGTGRFCFLVELSELQLPPWNLPTPALLAPLGMWTKFAAH